LATSGVLGLPQRRGRPARIVAIALLLTWHRAGFAWLALAFAVVATAVSSVASPDVVGGAFTPVTLNLGLGLLAAIDLLTLDGIPSAGRCRRRPFAGAVGPVEPVGPVAEARP
jgi:hypothetical protein